MPEAFVIIIAKPMDRSKNIEKYVMWDYKIYFADNSIALYVCLIRN